MGIGAALIMPATLSLLTNVFTDPRERGRAIGVWAAVAGAGGAIGPVIGGFLLAALLVGLGLPRQRARSCIVALVAGRFLLPTSRDPTRPGSTRSAPCLSIVGLVALLWAHHRGPDQGLDRPLGRRAASSSASLVLAGFVAWELHTDHPMLDVRFFENRRFTAANVAITHDRSSPCSARCSSITQYLQTVLGYSALEAGIRMLPMAVRDARRRPRWRPASSSGSAPSSSSAPACCSRPSGWRGRRRCPSTDGYPHLVVAMAHARGGMGLIDGAGHRVDHGLAAAGEGRRRLGHERHHPPDGRRPRRRRHRLGAGHGLPARA